MKGSQAAKGPVVTVRRAQDRGHIDHGWLDTHHTFSFGDYYDPDAMGFRGLRVINEDIVVPGAGFPTHGHRDMEIVTVVLEGAIAHKDSMGHEETLRPGEVQRMTAGRGVMHSEYNPSEKERLHLYQIWIETDRKGHAPEYEQKPFPEKERHGKLQLVVSPDAAGGSLKIHQDARMYWGVLEPGQRVAHTVAAGRGVWVQVARGRVRTGAEAMSAGDGAAVVGDGEVPIEAVERSEVLLFDLP